MPFFWKIFVEECIIILKPELDPEVPFQHGAAVDIVFYQPAFEIIRGFSHLSYFPVLIRHVSLDISGYIQQVLTKTVIIITYPGQEFDGRFSNPKEILSFGIGMSRTMDNNWQNINLQFPGQVERSFVESLDPSVGRPRAFREDQHGITLFDIFPEFGCQGLHPFRYGKKFRHTHQRPIEPVPLDAVVGQFQQFWV